jgi:hypothetical protein
MIIVWRGYGWLVPVILIATLILSSIFVDIVVGKENLPKSDLALGVSFFIGTIFIGLFGYYVNVKKRKIFKDPVTGEIRKSPSHTLFFVPIQYWSIILILFMIVGIYEQERKLIIYPQIDDKYITDFSKIFEEIDQEYKYGILKIIAVENDIIQVLTSDYCFTSISGVQECIQKNEDDTDDFYNDIENSIFFGKDELIDLHQDRVIRSIIRE